MRTLVVLVTYLVAVASGLLVYGVIGSIWSGFELSRLIEFVTIVLPTFTIILIVNYWLTPFAIAGLAASEFFKARHWIFYLAGGAALGIVICAQPLPWPYFEEQPPFARMLPYYSSVMVGSLIAGVVYWYIAWFKYPPLTDKAHLEAVGE